MSLRRDARRGVVLAFLFLAIASTIQGVSASVFFDKQILLNSKSNPALRVLLATNLPSNAQITTIITFSDVPTPEQIRELSDLGYLETFTGHVATIHLPRSNLPALASLEFVSHVSYPKQLSPRLDKSVPEILADDVWNTVRDAEGNSVNGTGVVVGIVDSGIDYTHRDFSFPNGTSKIIYLWDQSTSGNPPQGFDYGNECVRSDIQTGVCTEIDGVTNDLNIGHGTAVAAVAASSGEAATGFDSCLLFDGSAWHDESRLCQGSGGVFPLLVSASEYRYFGSSVKFNQVYFDIVSAGAYAGLSWEYSQGSGIWGPLLPIPDRGDISLSGAGVVSNDTLGLSRSGTAFITAPLNWMTDSVDGKTGQFWIRIKATTVTKAAMVGLIQGNAPYKGVAPGALIIPVKVRGEADDADVLDAVNYIKEKARELGLPCVVNISLGDTSGPHDGTGPLELAFTDLAMEGLPIVVSAGNSRNLDSHTDGTLSTGGSVTVSWTNDPESNPNSIDLWYSANDDVGISVKMPDGTIVNGPTTEFGVETSQGKVTILAGETRSGKEWAINVTAANSLTWSFTLTATKVIDGGWDAWVEPGKFLADTQGIRAGQYKIDPSDTIDYPGTAKGVITVGGYMTKYFWWSGCSLCVVHWAEYSVQNGQLVHGVKWTISTAASAGSLTYDSGMGPTRDGRTKPEITAPSANIAAARASDRPQSSSFSDPDNYHQIFRGTSFAAPHVTGVIALMLQMNHYLGPEEIKSILTQDARQDQFTGNIDKQSGSPLWGWGKVNALKSTRDANNFYSVRIQVSMEPVGRTVTTNVSLDGQNYQQLTLNETRTITLGFPRGANHTVSLTEIIQLDPGSRYKLTPGPQNFSDGELIKFDYKLQFLLEVDSAYATGVGGGWYDANSTALATVTPTSVPGYVFQGWIGSVSSESATVDVKMDSSKKVIAVWKPEPGMLNIANIIGLVIAIAVSFAIAAFVRYKTYRRDKNRGSA